MTRPDWRSLAWRAAPIVPLVALLVVWWFATTVLVHRPRIYADPLTVLRAIGDIAAGNTGLGSTWTHVSATLLRLVAAWGLSMVVGTLLGVLAGRSTIAFGFFQNVVWVLMATPSIVWVFIFAVAIGVSDWVPILAITALLGPQVLISVAEGTKSIPHDLIELADSYRVSRIRRLVDVYVPYLLPYVISSGRVTFALATKIILVAEVIALPSGVGYVVQFWDDQVFLGPVVAWGVLFTAFGILIDWLVFGRIEQRTARWSDRGASRPVPVVD